MPEASKPKYVGNFPGNSNKSREKAASKPTPPEKKKIEPVVEGKVVLRERSGWRKFKDVFRNDDAQTVGSYIVWEVLVPALKSMVFEAGSQGLERTLFGDVSSRRRSPGYGRSSYDKMYNSSGYREKTPNDRRDLSPRARRNHDFKEIILESRGEAEDVLDQMFMLIEKYEAVYVSDLYNILSIEPEFTDERWGWMDIHDAKAIPVRGGWLLRLPDPEELDQ